MRLVLVVGVSLLAVIVVLDIWLTFGGVNQTLAARLSQSLGRQVTIQQTTVSVWPTLGIRLSGLKIANMKGGNAPSALTARAVDLGFDPLRLLTGKILVRRLTLEAPTLYLERLSDGQANWALAKAAPLSRPRAATDLGTIQIDHLSIRSGRIVSRDDLRHTSEEIRNIQLEANLAGLDRPLRAKGRSAIGPNTAKFEFTFSAPRVLFSGGTSPLTFKLASTPVSVTFNGALGLKQGKLSGQLQASGPSLRRLAALSGRPLEQGPGLGPFVISSHLSQVGPRLRLEQARIRLDQIDATGDLTLNLGELRPRLAGRLDIPKLNLNPYLVLAKTAPAPTKPTGWSTAPIRLETLRTVNADLAIASAKLNWGRHTFSDVALNVSINSGHADVRVQRMSLYGGVGSGKLLILPAVDGVRLGLAAQLRGVQVQPLLSNSLKLNALRGSGALDLTLTAKGNSQSQIMTSLAGETSLSLGAGGLVGVNLIALSNDPRAVLTPGVIGPSAETPFETAQGRFTFVRGVATTQDLTLTGPGLSLAAKGQIDFGRQTLDMRVAKSAGQRRSGPRLSLSQVPLRISGAWSQLNFAPDLTGALKTSIGADLTQRLNDDLVAPGRNRLPAQILKALSGSKRPN